jgi:DNA helicase-2/ATP-dependent DNA helicase PcrA
LFQSSEDATSRLLADLNPEQLEAVKRVSGALVIRAGAGTGKTTTVSRRIAYGVASEQFRQQRVLALTYTNRSAAELRGRLRNLGLGRVSVRTMHSAALAQLQYFWPLLNGKPLPNVLLDKSAVIQGACRTVLGRTLKPAQIQTLQAELEWAKYSLTGIEAWSPKLRKTPIGLSETDLRAVLTEYERGKTEQNQLDWEDVLVLCLGMLLEQPMALDEVRQQYRHFTVDEYQDFSPLQQQLLQLWIGDRADICVVGDERQAIFGFTGATPEYLIGFQYLYPNAAEVELTQNYRSADSIVQLANRVLSRDPIRATRGGVGNVLRLRHANAAREAEAVATRIRDAISRGTNPQNIAVLARTSFQLSEVIEALRAEGIEVTANAGSGYWQQAEVRQALLMLRALQGKSDLEPLFIELHGVLASLGWQATAPNASSAAGVDLDRWQRLDWFNQILEELGDTPTLDEYLRELTERQQANQEPQPTGVTVSTIHAAKGLEWPEVYLVGVCEGKFPHPTAIRDDQRAEELRLLYVAVTRAKDLLVISQPGDLADGFRAALESIQQI